MFFKKNKTTSEAPFRGLSQPAPAVSQAAPSGAIPQEVIAAISGAVACMLGAGASVASIRPVASHRQKGGTRSAWSSAGLVDATRAF